MQRTADPRHGSCVRTSRATGRGPLIAIVGAKERMKTIYLSITLLLLGLQTPYAAPALTNAAPTDDDRGLEFAKGAGWEKEYRQGRNLLLDVGKAIREKQQLSVGAHRGETVAFIAGAAPPGGSNDLITPDGFYLRVMTPKNKDLRPRAVWWEVIVRGKVQQVLPENKIIVIEVDPKDWLLGATG